MTKEQKIALMKERIHVLSENKEPNDAICHKIARQIRKLEKQK